MQHYYKPNPPRRPDQATVFGWIFIIICLLMLSMMFTGCVTQKRCDAKFPPVVHTHTEHTTEIIRKDSILPGATVTHTIYHDSIIKMPVNQWRIIRDTSGLAELRFYKDAYGNIVAQCEANERMIEKMQQLVRELVSSTETKVQVVKEAPLWIKIMLVILSAAWLYVIGRMALIAWKTVGPQ